MQAAVNKLVGHVVSHGIRHVILCPGSRNAPLILAFSRHPDLHCHTLVDERSAAFTALGIAMTSGKPVALVCTSGTAVLNLYPAICEAYYAQIPLLVITADRPKELIDQWDGQCIRQSGIFEKHILGSYTWDPLDPMPDSELTAAISACLHPVMGPVHINIPLKEPLYEAKRDVFEYPAISAPFAPLKGPAELPAKLPYTRILMFAGYDAYGRTLEPALNTFLSQTDLPFIADITSNLSHCSHIRHWDLMLNMATDNVKNDLRPDLLITFGKFTVSKALKLFLREYPPLEHWHITDNHTIADPFKTGPKEIRASLPEFLQWLQPHAAGLPLSYKKCWETASQSAVQLIEPLRKPVIMDEFSVLETVSEHLQDAGMIHLANSMPVRWFSFMAPGLKTYGIFCNRGTSGIDGSVSTAAGASMVSDRKVILITGDLSLFYDANGLWNTELKGNLKILVLNNGGGGIFRLLPGPGDLPEREDRFVAASSRRASFMAKDMGLNYFSASDKAGLATAIPQWLMDSDRPNLLEVFTDNDATATFFTQFRELRLKEIPLN